MTRKQFRRPLDCPSNNQSKSPKHSAEAIRARALLRIFLNANVEAWTDRFFRSEILSSTSVPELGGRQPERARRIEFWCHRSLPNPTQNAVFGRFRPVLGRISEARSARFLRPARTACHWEQVCIQKWVAIWSKCASTVCSPILVRDRSRSVSAFQGSTPACAGIWTSIDVLGRFLLR